MAAKNINSNHYFVNKPISLKHKGENDEIGVLQDITHVKATDFILGDPFPG